MNTELIIKIESLKNMLVAQATGGVCDAREFRILRSELIAEPRIAHLLPRFVHTCRNPTEFWGFIKQKFSKYYERREFIQQEFDPLLTMLEHETNSPSDGIISATIQSVDSAYVQEAWQKALERRTTDPEGAITAARTLMETVCKHILDEADIPNDDVVELPKLYALTAKQLNLSPSQHTEQLFKQILGRQAGTGFLWFAEQKRIVARVDELMTLVDRLEAQLAESQAKAEKLMEAVVAEVVATKE